MKVLLVSYLFSPSVGGIEQCSRVLAEQFVAAGHQVRVVTMTTAEEGAAFPFQVLRRPSRSALWQACRWADVVFHNNITLRYAWPLVFCRRPWVIAHQTWIARLNGAHGWQDKLKRFLLRFARNISISNAIAESLPVASTVIGNPYREDGFQRQVGKERTGDLVYVGRLVSDKGVDLLLAAVSELGRHGIRPDLTVVGSGPEEERLREQAVEGGIGGQVKFTGIKQGPELSAILTAHRIILVPSRWQEPFGIVALEGIACGCFVIGSDGGGLKDAIGPCGVTFPNGDVTALAARLRGALLATDGFEPYLRHAEAHLAKHRPAAVAKRYLEVFEAAIRERKGC